MVVVIATTTFVPVSAAHAQSAARLPAPNPALGLQDGSVNRCDGGEKVVSSDVSALEPGALRQAPDYDATRTAVDSAYFTGLHVAAIRFSPPWDIANPSLVHQGKSKFAANARGALRVEQACLSYWLAALAVRSTELGITIVPQIAFKPDYNYVDNPAHPTKILVPSLSTYRKAVDEFMHLYVNASGCTCGCREPHPPHTTRRYSLIRPPARACLRTRYCSGSTGPGSGFSGAAAWRKR